MLSRTLEPDQELAKCENEDCAAVFPVGKKRKAAEDLSSDEDYAGMPIVVNERMIAFGLHVKPGKTYLLKPRGNKFELLCLQLPELEGVYVVPNFKNFIVKGRSDNVVKQKPAKDKTTFLADLMKLRNSCFSFMQLIKDQEAFDNCTLRDIEQQKILLAALQQVVLTSDLFEQNDLLQAPPSKKIKL